MQNSAQLHYLEKTWSKNIKMTCGGMFWSIKEHFLTQLISKPLHNRSTNLRESRAYTCWHAVFLPSHCRRWHSWSSPSHMHTRAHGQTHITPLLLCIHPSCMCATESEQQRKNSGLSLFLYLSLLHPLHSLSVVLKHVLLTERVSSASPTRNALNPAFFFPSLSVSLPSFPPFSSHRACIFN